MKKIAVFAFNGDPICFIHVLLNTLDMKEKGYDVKLVIEGSATALIPLMVKENHPLNGLYEKVKDREMVDCVCKACANKMETLEAAEKEGLPVCGSMSGHPSMADYMEMGYQIITF
jgi:hypothetical protein